MQDLDYSNMKREDETVCIPYRNDPCKRIRVVTSTEEVTSEYECVDFVWNEHSGQDEEVWSWRHTYLQPSAEEKALILKEIDRYAENKILLSCQVR